MTEEEWLTETNPGFLINCTDELEASDRKLRFLGCACVRRLWHLLTALQRECVEATERYADGLATADELQPLSTAVEEAYHADFTGDAALDNAALGVCYLSGVPGAAVNEAILKIAGAFAEDKFDKETPWHVVHNREMAFQSHLVRDIFGNPFRPVSFSSTWRTDTAVTLARQMYDSRDFSAMPILADALQDAGCDSDDVLSHCRDTSLTHVRGCWVVDLVLGKG
jgi:hypothetical protein